MRSLKVTEANRAWAGNYSREFRAWIKRHGFDKMPAATRSVAVELHEHAEAITSWRDGCQSDKGDGSFTRYRSQDAGEPLSARQMPTQDLRRDAQQAWARFCACTKALPADQAAPLWATVTAEAQLHLRVAPSRPAAGSGQKKVICGPPWCLSSSV